MMKNYVRMGLGLVLLMVLFATSCQKEESESYFAPDVLNASSPLTGLLKRVALAHAVDDNVMDSATCYKMKLPVQIAVNGQSLTIATEINYQQIADIFNASNSDQDHIDFVYPLTVIYDNGDETIVEDIVQLQQLHNACPVPAGEAPIGCFGLTFPFTASLYDSGSQTPQMVTISNSFDLLAFIVNLGSSQYYQINYPLTVSIGDFPQAVHSNDELITHITAAVSECSCDNPNILTDNLIVYMPFAGDLADLTGFSTPDPFGSFGYVTDRSGNLNGAISFNANDGNTRIDIPQNANNTVAEGESFSLSLWFSRQDDGPLGTFEQLIYSPQLSIFLGNDTQPDQRGPVVMYDGIPMLYDFSWANSNLGGDVGNWHHVAVTYDGTALVLYRDGVYVTQAGIDSIAISDIDLGGFFKGKLDDVRIYKSALSGQDVLTLYNLGGDISHCLN